MTEDTNEAEEYVECDTTESPIEDVDEKEKIKFAKQIDALAEQLINRLEIEKCLEKMPAPIKLMMKGMGQDISTFTVRNMCYQLAMRFPDRTYEFLEWLQLELQDILSRVQYDLLCENDIPDNEL